MAIAPFARLLRRMSIPLPTNLPTSPSHLLTPAKLHVAAAFQRLDLRLSPASTIERARKWQPSASGVAQLAIMFAVWVYALSVMTAPLLVRIAIPALWALVVLVPFSSQLMWPATPVLTWVILFFSARYIPSDARPAIHVNLLPALESVMYGANISDLQTRYTHPLLDILAWLPYGVLHFMLPVVVALLLWIFGPRGSAQYWGKAFGFMNLFGVITQILLPCAAPWYEIIHGLTPANYKMSGSPGGLLRIDRVFNSNGYTNTFGSAPLVFGAFPSLHSGCAVMEALFLAHFFPFLKPLYWGYVGILWWATMYLSHHYLIDLTGGASLSVLVFYLFMPDDFKDIDNIHWPSSAGGGGAGAYEMVQSNGHAEVDFDEEIRKLEEEGDDSAIADDVESQLPDSPSKPRTKRTVSWGETRVLGEEGSNGEGSSSSQQQAQSANRQ
ncbi:Ribonucleases P/MRP protein subunit pop1 [Vanrija albida]|uniref:Ribonucleases P/MRP protein subunit pop1 n=1 Tax=Vanrija albida TaxID=181172 RepID=A0ABR3Q9I8_9TREE